MSPRYLRLIALALVVGAFPIVVTSQRQAAQVDDYGVAPGTFSILGFDPETGEVGAAVQSRVFSAGNGVLWAEAGAGVVCYLVSDVFDVVAGADDDRPREVPAVVPLEEEPPSPEPAGQQEGGAADGRRHQVPPGARRLDDEEQDRDEAERGGGGSRADPRRR